MSRHRRDRLTARLLLRISLMRSVPPFWLSLSLAGMLAGSTASLADPPSHPVDSFSTAKRIARDVIYKDHRITLYCGCIYVPNATGTSGKIGNLDCGYRPRKSEKRGMRLEWEHIMPAAIFGRTRSCWTNGHRLCTRIHGKTYAGRNCCSKVDEEFKRIEADLHNLAPAVGELNGDRSDRPYSLIRGEKREYGSCDFEVDFRRDEAEPLSDIRGDVARVWFYMRQTYDIELDPDIAETLTKWSSEDPPDDWERERDSRIADEQGNHNPFVQQ